MAKIQDDINDYLYLCKYFDKKPKYTKDFYNNEVVDCYGKHADKLKKKFKKIVEKETK